MTIGFRSNSIAVRTLRALDRSTAALGRVNNQLSSGLRINSASDDPAGLAVASGLTTKARVQNRAALNINDGISVLQVADGAFQGATQIVTRMAEIAAQAANGSFSSTQRGALNKELSALTSELNRIKASVTFNGRSLLQGGAVNGTAKTLATGNNVFAQASSDGRYVTYLNSNTLYQQDTSTGVVTTIATGVSATGMAATSRGDYVVYNQGSSIMRYDRLAGTSTSLGTVTSLDLLSISDDGSRVAFVSRYAYTAAGGLLGTPGGRHVTTIDTQTGQFTGDNGGNGWGSYSSLALSADGTRVALVTDAGAIYESSASTLNEGFSDFIFSGIVATKLSYGSGNSLTFSSASNVGGLNSSGIANVYRTVNRESFLAVTNITSGAGVSNFFMTDNGNSVTFASTANLVGQNIAGRTQLYKADYAGNYSQLTSFTGTEASNLATVSGDGNTFYTSTSSLFQSRDILGENRIVIDTGDGVAGLITGQIRGLDSAIRGLASLDASTQRLARLSLDVINSNIQGLGLASSVIGAGLVRLESAYRSTKIEALESTTARNRIQDVDVASGFAEQVRLSILGDVQVSLLASAAKMVPEIALNLLKSAGTQGT